jgi:hypothetical protein
MKVGNDMDLIQSQRTIPYVRFEVFTAVTMKNGVVWVVMPCGSCKNRRFGGTWRLLQLATDLRCEEILGISSQRTSVASCSLCCS